MRAIKLWKSRSGNLKREITALYLACKDPRVPWYAKAVALSVVGYALSPIDLIPDPIPVLGYLDDLIIIPIGIALFIRLVPTEVLDECRLRAEEKITGARKAAWIAAGVVILLWAITILLLITLLKHTFS